MTDRAPAAETDTGGTWRPVRPDGNGLSAPRVAHRQPPANPPRPSAPPARPPAEEPARPARQPLGHYSPQACDEFYDSIREDRQWLYDNVVSRVLVDITPAKPVHLEDPAEGQVRTWHDRQGKEIARGRLVDYKQGRITIEREDGQTLHVPFGRLSDADMCYVNSMWHLPLEFVLSDDPAPRRDWTPITLAWKASELCNKPLYFEEVQLERYGHTRSPYVQPFVSGAHFFLNIAVLPYKMGIHPLHECRYDLGYYRPGSCAPWLLPPVPLSVRGGLLEAGVLVGGAAVLP